MTARLSLILRKARGHRLRLRVVALALRGPRLQWHLLLLFSLFTVPCFGQEAPAWQFFGGYSFQRADVREYFKTTPILYPFRHHYVNMNRWGFSVTENRNRWFGRTLDFSGYTKTPQFKGISTREEIYSILYGPRITYRGANVPNPAGKALWGASAFAHVLFGATHTSVSVTPTGPHVTEFTFGMALGGGFDLPLRNEISVRVLQAEYLRNSFGDGQNNYRLSAGVAFNIGKAK